MRHAWRCRRSSLGAAGLILALLIAGCTSWRAPIHLDSLPSVPGLSRYEGDTETTLDSLSTALRLALGKPSIEIVYYFDPESLDWSEISASYDAILAPEEWTPDVEGNSPTVTRWSRPCRGGKQFLVLAAIPNVAEGRIVALLLGED